MTVYGGIKTKVHRGTSIYYVNILKGWVQKMAIFAVQGGFQLLDLIITELKSHMTCYNSKFSLAKITAFRLESKS